MKRGRPVSPLMKTKGVQHVSMYMPVETMARLDQWRARQFVPPPRTAAIRTIIRIFLEREEKSK